MMRHFNKLTPAELERLSCLAEECAEVIQAVSKIIRHGYEDFSPHDATKTTNRANLERELGDLRYWMIEICNKGDCVKDNIHNYAIVKAERVLPYLHHQED